MELMKLRCRFFCVLAITMMTLQVLGQGRHVKAAEYFWDTDPGQGNGTAMIAVNGSFTQAFEAITKNTNSLPSAGFHSLNVRVQDSLGIWGPVFTTVVQVNASSTSLRTDNIVAGEYFWDTDPGAGNGLAMIAFDGSFNAVFEQIAQTATPPGTGNHTINIRAKDVNGNWGKVFTVVVNVSGASTSIRSSAVTAAEYFFDADPGQGNGTPMAAQSGFGHDFQALLGSGIPSPVVAGIHLLSMRAKEINGNWGPVFSMVVNIDTTVGRPTVHISGPSILCSNNLSGRLYAVAGVAGNTYSWSITGGVITAGAGTDSVTVNWNNSGPYKLLVTQCNGVLCASDSMVPVVILPVHATANQTICSGQAYNGHNQAGTYTDTLTSYTGCDSILTLHLTVLQPVTATVTITLCQGQSYGGHSTAGTFVDTFTSAEHCDSIRTLNLAFSGSNLNTTNSIQICAGQSYYGHTVSGTYADTFTAVSGCDSINTLILTVIPPIYDTLLHNMCQGDTFMGHSTAGFYTDSLVAVTGCDSLVTLHLIVTPLPPAPTVTFAGQSLVASDISGLTYQWYRDSMILSGDTNPVLVITQNGSYAVVATNSTGCSNISPVMQITNLGVSSILQAGDISVFPNPASGVLHITSNVAGLMNLKLTNALGQIVLEKQTESSLKFNTELDLAGFANGIYLLQMQFNGYTFIRKVVVER